MNEDRAVKLCGLMAALTAVCAGMDFWLSGRRREPLYTLAGLAWLASCFGWIAQTMRRWKNDGEEIWEEEV